MLHSLIVHPRGPPKGAAAFLRALPFDAGHDMIAGHTYYPMENAAWLGKMGFRDSARDQKL